MSLCYWKSRRCGVSKEILFVREGGRRYAYGYGKRGLSPQTGTWFVCFSAGLRYLPGFLGIFLLVVVYLFFLFFSNPVSIDYRGGVGGRGVHCELLPRWQPWPCFVCLCCVKQFYFASRRRACVRGCGYRRGAVCPLVLCVLCVCALYE